MNEGQHQPNRPQPQESMPLVSVVIPLRNEADFVATLIQQVTSQDYPADRLEVIIADGMSDDGTREILTELAEQDRRITVVDNPQRIVPTGLNAAIKLAKGTVIIRIDGHVEIADDFIRRNVELLAEYPDAWTVGGPIVHVGRNTFAKAAACAMSHPCGVGNATHRFADFEGYGEGTAFPAYRREVFDQVGEFDEQLVRNQDDEMNYRIVQAGGKNFISSKVKYRYFVRDRIDRLFRQYFQYSFWRIPMIRKHRRPTTLRQLAPPLFFGVMFVLLLIGIWQRNWWIALGLPVTYAATLLLIGVTFIPRVGLKVAMLVPVAMATMHLAYAWGFAYGGWSLLFSPNAWDPAGKMTTLSR